MSCLYDGKGLLCLTLNDAVLFIIDFILPQTISNRFIEKRYQNRSIDKQKSCFSVLYSLYLFYYPTFQIIITIRNHPIFLNWANIYPFVYNISIINLLKRVSVFLSYPTLSKYLPETYPVIWNFLVLLEATLPFYEDRYTVGER